MKVTARTGSHSSRYPDRYLVLPTLVILVPAVFDLYSGLRNKAFPSPATATPRTTEMKKTRLCAPRVVKCATDPYFADPNHLAHP